MLAIVNVGLSQKVIWRRVDVINQIYKLLIECDDKRGLIAKVTTLLNEYRCNIISNHEFVDRNLNLFMMRAEFQGNIDAEIVQKKLLRIMPRQAKIKVFPKNTQKSIVILATTEPHCVGDLMLRSGHDLSAEIKCVISNHNNLETLVKRFDYDFHYVPAEKKSRKRHEHEILAILHHHKPDYIILAKYMRILSPEFVDEFPNQMINIHHSFLPAFIGAKPYEQAYRRGVKIIGATAHFVTKDLDNGPIIKQNVIHVDHSHSAHDMARFGRDVEKTTLAHAVDLVLDDRVFIANNRTVIFA